MVNNQYPEKGSYFCQKLSDVFPTIAEIEEQEILHTYFVWKFRQCAKKVLSNSPGLLDFPVRLVANGFCT